MPQQQDCAEHEKRGEEWDTRERLEAGNRSTRSNRERFVVRIKNGRRACTRQHEVNTDTKITQQLATGITVEKSSSYLG